MRLHHLNCGAFCPLLGGEVVTHCLLAETPRNGLLLVDTGFGDECTRDPKALPWLSRVQLRPKLHPEDSALRQVQALGYQASDVRHICVTHLDGDHELAREHEEVRVFSSHDPREFRGLVSQEAPAAPVHSCAG